MLSRTLFAVSAMLVLAACDPGPTGYGTAPPGVSQEAHDAQVQAERKARRDFYSRGRAGVGR